MALTYRPSGSSSTFRLGGGGSSHPSTPGGHGHGVLGIVKNLAVDVKDAAYGMPEGLVQLVKHPIRTGEAIGKTTWQTWSPLFHGHIGKFAHGVYDHPLAPLLDLATVYSLGAAAATGGLASPAFGAAVGAKIAEDGALEAGGKLARLHSLAKDVRAPKSLKVEDPTGAGRPALSKTMAPKAGHRLIQEAVLAAEPHMPQWLAGGIKNVRYEKAHISDVTHRVAAKSLIVSTALKAGKALTDPATAPRAMQEIAVGMYTNLIRHGHRMTDEAAANALATGHYGVVTDARMLDGEMRLAHSRATSRIDRLNSIREAHAPAAHSLQSIHEELQHQNELLAEMQQKGYRVATKAKTRLAEPTTKQIMENQSAPLVEVQNNIKQLEKLRQQARVSQKIHSRATSELDKEMQTKLAYEGRSFTDYFRKAGESPAAFEDFANNLGRKVVRGGDRNIKGKLAAAARDANGNVIVVPLHDARNLGREAVNSSRMLKLLYQKPTRIWKMALLGYSPRVVINNGVGNWLLYMMRTDNPVEAIRSVRDGIAAVHGAKVADSTLKAAHPFRHNHWLYRHFGDELGNTFQRELEMSGLQGAKQGFYPLVHKLADEPVRAASIMSALRKAPEVQALMKEKGLSFDKAAARALRKNPELQGRVALHSQSIAGDYVTLGSLEKKVREVVPFYLWDRHIVRTSKHLVLEQPGRVALTAAAGQIGADKTRQQLGNVPSFMLGMVPLPAKDGFRKLMLNTVGANPFSTVPELIDTARAATIGGTGQQTGEALSSQMNPIIASIIEQVSGHKLTTDGTVQRTGGLIPSVLSAPFESLPAAQLIEKAMGKTFTPKPGQPPPLYSHDMGELLSSLAGIPIRKANLTRAHQLAAQEEGTHKKKRVKGVPSGSFRIGG